MPVPCPGSPARPRGRRCGGSDGRRGAAGGTWRPRPRGAARKVNKREGGGDPGGEAGPGWERRCPGGAAGAAPTSPRARTAGRREPRIPPSSSASFSSSSRLRLSHCPSPQPPGASLRRPRLYGTRSQGPSPPLQREEPRPQRCRCREVGKGSPGPSRRRPPHRGRPERPPGPRGPCSSGAAGRVPAGGSRGAGGLERGSGTAAPGGRTESLAGSGRPQPRRAPRVPAAARRGPRACRPRFPGSSACELHSPRSGAERASRQIEVGHLSSCPENGHFSPIVADRRKSIRDLNE